MPVSYTFEKDVIWVTMHGKLGANELIKTLCWAFKDERFTPGETSIIYNLAIFSQTTYSEKDRKKIVSFLIANPIDRSAAIVSDPVRCKAANKYQEYLAECGVRHAAFCIPEHAMKFVKGDDTVRKARYDSCTTTPAPECLCKGRQVISEVKTLHGFLTMCSSCKKIRDDNGYWNQIERYIGEHSEAEISHGICPDCTRKLYPDLNL
jgi:hypothetical protein